MQKVDISKYVDLEMEYSLKGGNGYMIPSNVVKRIIESEMALPYEYIPMCINDSRISLTESKIKKYCLRNLLKYHPETLEYYRKMISIYKHRTIELLEIIDLLGRINIDSNEKNIDIRKLNTLAEYYDLMINRHGEIYYKDLERILNPFLYNMYKLLNYSLEANDIENYSNSKTQKDNKYPTTSLQSRDIVDEGLIPLTEKQKKIIIGNQKIKSKE